MTRHVARFSLLAFVATAVLAACGGGDSASATTPVPTVPTPTTPTVSPLRTLAETRSLRIGIGTAVGSLFNTTDATGTQYMKLLAQEFNVLVPENDMKFDALHPARSTYRFTRADSMVAFARANNMRVRGHVLVWYNQLPSWLTGGTWTAAEARTLMDEHITTVATHFRGQLAAWDVVNEAYTDGSTPTLRSGFWADRIGRGYIEQAFRTATTADPSVALYYNDYNIEATNAKSDSVYNLLRDFTTRGVPVHGVGMQMHLIAGTQPLTSMAENFARFAALGLKIQITELDIRVPTPSTAQSLSTQAQNYREIYNLCLQQPACDMVVTWGFTDRASWIPSTFPGQGDALLFDNTFQPKPAYTSVNNLLAGR